VLIDIVVGQITKWCAHYVVIIAAHCESNLRLLESGIRAIQCEYFTH